MWEKAKDFLRKAFAVIFAATVIIWFLQTFDGRLNVTTDGKNSLLAALGQLIAPLFTPLGFGDWRAAASLVTGFTAKEAVVSTMSVLTGTTAENLSTALGGLFTPASAVSFLVFTLLYTPCVAAVAAIRRELGSGLKTICTVAVQCAVAWIFSFAAYRLFSLIL